MSSSTEVNFPSLLASLYLYKRAWNELSVPSPALF
nr:MAG TPA: hypothetical protein [Bacteriophage sp.]